MVGRRLRSRMEAEKKKKKKRRWKRCGIKITEKKNDKSLFLIFFFFLLLKGFWKGTETDSAG